MRTRRFIPASLVAFAFVVVLPVPASARQLPLDTSFGSGGTVESAFGPTFSQIEFGAVEVQPDGSILAALRHGSEEGAWLRRYEADGNRDLGYGQVGFHPQPEAVQADGKVLRLAGGDSLQRFEPDGTPDPSFGTQAYGSGMSSDSVPFSIEDIVQLPSGDILVGGKRMKYVPGVEEPEYVFDQLAVARFDEHGKLDPGFGGGDGVVLLGDDYGFHAERLLGIAPRPGEEVTILAQDTAPSQFGEAVSHSGTALLGLTSTGGRDPGYGEGGAAHLDGLVVDFHSFPDGSLLFAGDSWGSPLAPGRTVVSSNLFLARYGNDGRPDPSFGTAGEAIADFGGLDLARAMLVEADGSILLGGGTTDSGSSDCRRFYRFCDEEPVLARFTPSGQPDPTFGDGGLLRLAALAEPYGSLEDNIGVMALASRPSGRILAVGGSGSAAFLAGLSPAGELEPGFGDGGIVVEREPSPSSAAAHALGVDGRGRILVAGGTDAGLADGPAGSPENAVFRYLPGGGLDTSYGQGLGYLRVPETGELAVDRDGAVVVSSSQTPLQLTRVTPAGEIDTAFGEEGTTILPSPRHGARLASLVLLPGGGIVAAGTMPGKSRIAVFRARADGSPDRAFGRDGFALFAFGQGRRSEVGQMTVDPRGRILIVGSVGVSSHETLAAMRILPTGRLDRRFGRHGVTHLRAGRRSLASAVQLQADGEILIGGRAWHRSVLSDLLLRLRSSGGLDRRFAHGGISWVRAPGKYLQSPEAILKLSNRILVLRRGRAGQVLAYRTGGRFEGSFSVPGTPKSRRLTSRPLGAMQGHKALLAAQIRSRPDAGFELLRLGFR